MRLPRLWLVGIVLALALAPTACGLLRRAPAEPPAIDLNTASKRKIERLPGITPTMAARIIRGRPYDDPHQLIERGILTERELDRLSGRVVVKGRAP